MNTNRKRKTMAIKKKAHANVRGMDAIRMAFEAHWPPAAQQAGSWSEAIAWLEAREADMRTSAAVASGDDERWTYWIARAASYRSAARHFRTLTAAPGGETKAEGVYKLLCEQEAAKVATRDADIARLTRERDHASDTVKAGDAEIARLTEAAVHWGDEARRQQQRVEAAVVEEREACFGVVSERRSRILAGSMTIEILEDIEDAIVARSTPTVITQEAKDMAAKAMVRFQARARSKPAVVEMPSTGRGGAMDALQIVCADRDVWKARATAADTRIADLEAKLTEMTSERDAWRQDARNWIAETNRMRGVVGAAVAHVEADTTSEINATIQALGDAVRAYQSARGSRPAGEEEKPVSLARRIDRALAPLLTAARAEGHRAGLLVAAGECGVQADGCTVRDPGPRDAYREMQKHLEALAATGAKS